jgi:hypothetical protein
MLYLAELKAPLSAGDLDDEEFEDAEAGIGAGRHLRCRDGFVRPKGF